jgi:hypothetical protein
VAELVEAIIMDLVILHYFPIGVLYMKETVNTLLAQQMNWTEGISLKRDVEQTDEPSRSQERNRRRGENSEK